MWFQSIAETVALLFSVAGHPGSCPKGPIEMKFTTAILALACILCAVQTARAEGECERTPS
jgi:hypothetical protein